MAARLVVCVGVTGLSLTLAGCFHGGFDSVADANLKPRDRMMLASASYRTGVVPFGYRRSIVSYHRRERPGTIVVDTDSRYLYYVLPEGQAIRYGVTVGEDALAFSGVARVGNKTEWPGWTPTAATKRRMGNLPDYVPPGGDNPMGARALYIHQGSRDTLYRIHGTNQPEHIGQAISSGCIRMTNEDVIDLFNRAKVGTPVVVLAQSNSVATYSGVPYRSSEAPPAATPPAATPPAATPRVVNSEWIPRPD